jgi:chorismate mutase/prephenate dehydratase
LSTQNKIAFLGPEGTFSQTAVVTHFGNSCVLFNCSSIDEVFLAVQQKRANYGVVPVENSTEGGVNNTQDCLIDSTVSIVGEVIVPIIHHLLVPPGTAEVNITKIMSHKQSLAQCRQWISKSFPGVELVECASNAEASKLASESDTTAAIAGSLAAEVYGLEILRDRVQDQHHNSTRFLVLSNSTKSPSGSDKTSALIYAENKPGALFRILEPFDNLRVNLTKIETRPAKIEAWAYVFFIDFEGHVEDDIIVELFKRLEACTAEIKILGSYPIFVNA